MILVKNSYSPCFWLCRLLLPYPTAHCCPLTPSNWRRNCENWPDQNLASYVPLAKPSPLSVSIDKVYWNTPIACLLSIADFTLHGQSQVAVRETVWLTKPKIFTIWPFGAKVWYNQIIEHLPDHQKMRNKGSNGWNQAVKLTNLPYSSHLSGLSANSTRRYKVPNFPLKFQEAFLKWASF